MEVDIKKIAKLSRLNIEPEKEAKFQKDMENIIAMVEKLPDMGSEELRPLVEDRMELREDVICNSLSREEILKNAPQVTAGCVEVPKTVV